MSDIFDDVDLSAVFDSDDLIRDLFRENLRIQMRLSALHDMVLDLFMESKGMDEEQVVKFTNSLMATKEQEVLESNKLLFKHWRNKTKNELGGMPGIAFTGE